MYYLDTLREPDDFDDVDVSMDLFTFIAEASKRLPDFLEIHMAQRKKELWAWTEIIGIAKSSKEIKANIPDEELAGMFLKISDGIVMERAITRKSGQKTLEEIKQDWDNLYNLLKTSKKDRS
jgi:hypothetical protein